jgi:hypothetical protein
MAISIFGKHKLKLVYLYFARNSREAASLVDPMHPDMGQRQADHTMMDGNYYINGENVGEATHVFTDSTGSERLQHPYYYVYNAWIADDSGFVTKIKNFEDGNNSFLDIANKKAWQETQIGYTTTGTQYAHQIASAHVNTANNEFYSLGHGVAYADQPDFYNLEPQATKETRFSLSPYLMGQAQTLYNHLIVDMSYPSNVKPYINTNGSSWLNINSLVGAHKLHDGITGASDTGTINTRTDFLQQGGANYGGPLTASDAQFDYINNTLANGPVGTSTSIWVIQYSTNSYGVSYAWGPMETLKYPIASTTAHDGYCGSTSYHQWWMHMRNNYEFNQGYATCCDHYYLKLFIASSTPSASGGDDNGNPAAGWYRPTGSSGSWTYFNGVKFTHFN